MASSIARPTGSGPGLELARLARIARSTGEAVTLGVRSREIALYVAQRDGSHNILSVGDWVGRSTTLPSTATGKVLLAFSDGHAPGRRERHTAHTIVRPTHLKEELERTRRRGFGLMRDELEEGLSAAAAPVYDTVGTCVAAVAVSGPSFRLAGSLTALGGQCVDAADEITRAFADGRRVAATDNRQQSASTD